MIGKLIGAYVGGKAAQRARGGMDGTTGALLGAGAVTLARRFGFMGMVAAAAGGYALKRYSDNKQARSATGRARKRRAA